MKMVLLLFCFWSISITGLAQSAYLSSIDTWLIGPDNVSERYDAQFSYYAVRLDSLERLIDDEIKLSSASWLEQKKSKQSRMRVKKEMKQRLKELNVDKKTINVYKSLWNFNNQNDRIIPTNEVWKEYYPNQMQTTNEKIVVQESRTDYVEKKDPNCVKRNPDDCIITCFETIPAKYRTLKKTTKEACAEGFRQDPNKDRCIRYISFR